MVQLQACFCFLLRLALAATLLSGIADRFGFWGSPGATNIIWGNFQYFLAYTKKVDYFLPADWVQVVAWTTTVLEIFLGILLLIGLFHRFAAFATGILLLAFAIVITLSFGIKFSLNYSLFVAASASLLLGTIGPGWLAADQLRGK